MSDSDVWNLCSWLVLKEMLLRFVLYPYRVTENLPTSIVFVFIVCFQTRKNSLNCFKRSTSISGLFVFRTRLLFLVLHQDRDIYLCFRLDVYEAFARLVAVWSACLCNCWAVNPDLGTCDFLWKWFMMRLTVQIVVYYSSVFRICWDRAPCIFSDFSNATKFSPKFWLT